MGDLSLPLDVQSKNNINDTKIRPLVCNNEKDGFSKILYM